MAATALSWVMDIFTLLLRMAMWVRRPPSRQHIWVMVVVVSAAAFCVGFQALFVWPEALTGQPLPRNILIRP